MYGKPAVERVSRSLLNNEWVPQHDFSIDGIYFYERRTNDIEFSIIPSTNICTVELGQQYVDNKVDYHVGGVLKITLESGYMIDTVYRCYLDANTAASGVRGGEPVAYKSLHEFLAILYCKLPNRLRNNKQIMNGIRHIHKTAPCPMNVKPPNDTANQHIKRRGKRVAGLKGWYCTAFEA